MRYSFCFFLYSPPIYAYLHRKVKEREILKKKFETFYQENYARFYYYALHLVPDSETCKDLVNDTFFFMWERMEMLRMGTALTYMYTHLQRLCIDHLRKQQRQANNEQTFLLKLKEWNDDEHRESEARIRTIMKLIENMPPLTRTIMEQCYLYKKTYQEVAVATGLSESGVRKHIMKGLNTLREYYSVTYKKGKKQ